MGLAYVNTLVSRLQRKKQRAFSHTSHSRREAPRSHALDATRSHALVSRAARYGTCQDKCQEQCQDKCDQPLSLWQLQQDELTTAALAVDTETASKSMDLGRRRGLRRPFRKSFTINI